MMMEEHEVVYPPIVWIALAMQIVVGLYGLYVGVHLFLGWC